MGFNGFNGCILKDEVNRFQILDFRFQIKELKKATPLINPGACTLAAFGQRFEVRGKNQLAVAIEFIHKAYPFKLGLQENIGFANEKWIHLPGFSGIMPSELIKLNVT